MKMIYGKASNRLNELKSELPFVKKRFDCLINSIASHKNSYTVRMEIGLSKDLDKLEEKWRRKAAKSAGWFDKKG
jgi:hypothetical protein|tara:strand:- start:363 stop:587 length:225 start_codon:yes stop_codon:yes gene_type:complete